MVVKNHRVAVEKKRKDLKADALEWGRKVDAEAKRITVLLEPIEVHLQTEEDKVTKEKERIRTQKILDERERVAGIRVEIQRFKALAMIDPSMKSIWIKDRLIEIDKEIVLESAFQEFTQEALLILSESRAYVEECFRGRLKWEEEQVAAKAEAERLEKVRKNQEAEAKRLEGIRKAEEEKSRLEREYLETERRKIEAEKTALEAKKAAEAQKKRQEEFEKQVLETARIKAEKDVAEKVAREAREAKEKAEAEAAEKARKAALAPDKDKILIWARELNQRLLDMSPDLSADEPKRIIFNAEKAIDKAVAFAVKQAKEL